MKLVTIKKFSETTGYSEEAVHQKRKKGVWRLREHFYKAPDGRILIDMGAIEIWIKKGVHNESL